MAYVAQGDGWGISLPLMDDNHPIIRAALNGDTPEVRRQMSLGVSLARAMYHLSCTGDANTLAALLEAGGNGEVNARGDIGWTALGAAATGRPGRRGFNVRRWSDATRGPGPYFGGLEIVALFCAPARLPLRRIARLEGATFK